MTDIYKQHDAAFANVSAFVIMGRDTDDHGNPQRVATVSIKFPKDGAGRLYAYVRWLGSEMVRGYANGYGYDKRSAAVAVAGHLLPAPYQMSDVMAPKYVRPESAPQYDAFRFAIMASDGREWQRKLEDAGFTVWQAV